MEYLSSYLTKRMIDNHIIAADDVEYYCYSIQIILERIVCLFAILTLAVVFRSFVGVFLFLAVFTTIRKRANGFHCNTSLGCFLVSIIVSISTIPISRVINDHCVICVCVVVLSMIVLLIIATFDDPSLYLTAEELIHLKRSSRITVTIICFVLISMLLIFPSFRFVSYMTLGVMYNALSLLIAILTERRKKRYDEEKS